ncbi:hypothetical protein DSM112329_05036 [Paraconexibacter sp. AEG42_29]|uniref:Uncharacterized protein n=1 Tax=Paraconexibacter sp. AEG42_29 TaxID=2997339 RepID=A0AAU7B2B4_9ACTN
MDEDGFQQTPAERAVARALIDESGVGKPLSRRAMQRERSVETYLRGSLMPRYMQRAAEIEQWTVVHAQALRAAYARLEEAHARDPEGLEAAWTQTVEGWNFSKVNLLIQQHNAWYPIERDLPMDPRTGDYVLVHGRSYRREELGPAWARTVLIVAGD